MTEIPQQINRKPLKVGILACTQRHLSTPAQAKVYYSISPLFRFSLRYCEANYDKVYLLSGKFGLIDPERYITDEDDVNISIILGVKFKDFLKKLADQISQIVPPESEIYLLAGKRLRHLKRFGQNVYTYHEPLKGMGIGKQLKWLKSQI